MGKTSRKRRMDGSPVDRKPSDIIEDIDFGSLSLEAFAAGDKGGVAGQSIVQGYGAQPVDEYNREKDRFEDLHRSITACDQVLKSVETYLTGFQADLGAVSSEIETLQSKSAAMNSKLENRRVVEKLLGPAAEDISLSPAIVRKISEEQIDESWVKALAELEKRCKVVETRAKEDKKMKAIHDLKPLLDDLIAKV
jgi:septal ring factor EnvC (AmiA/AmiB activator)